MLFSDALHIKKGITSIIGSGGKTSLMLRLAQELCRSGRVIVTTSTMIYPPENIETVRQMKEFDGCLCIGTPCANGKLASPEVRFEDLAKAADFVLVEADGSKHLPLKVHLSHEPVIVPGSDVICVIGASGLNRPVADVVHRSVRFSHLTGESIATPEAVATALRKENSAHRYLINQAETNFSAARELAGLLNKPTVLACIEKGEILCVY